MRRLWLRMAEIYGHRWTSSYGDDAGAGAGETWAKGLAGLTPSQIAAGVEAALVSADEWPPTLPHFRRLCLSIPSLAVVAKQLRDTSIERTGFARLVWSQIDGYRFRQADADKADRMLRDAYEMAVEHAMRGGELPAEPVAAIAAEPPSPRQATDPETAARNIAQMREMLARKPDPVPAEGAPE